MTPEQTRQFIIEELQEAQFTGTTITDEILDFITNIDLSKCEHNPSTMRLEPTAFGFSINDIKDHAQEQMNGIELTDAEARECIALLNKRGDLSNGVGWHTVEFVVGEFLDEYTDLGKAIRQQGHETDIELTKDDSTDKDGTTFYKVNICFNDSIADTVEFYDEAEADRQMANCEAYYPNVTLN